LPEPLQPLRDAQLAARARCKSSRGTASRTCRFKRSAFPSPPSARAWLRTRAAWWLRQKPLAGRARMQG